MRAAVHTEYGPPDVVRIREVDKPVAAADELLVRVHATTVNRTDAATRSASPFFARAVTGLLRPRATVLGCEFAGTVETTGQSVRGFRPGERVFGYVEGPFGAHAEYLTIPEAGSLATIPAGTTFEQAAAATEGSHYALVFLRTARVGVGHTVLVNGATGAIGSAAVQLARALGAQVTAVAGPDSVDLVKGLGADRFIDYTTTDFTLDNQTYDVVIDAVGSSSFRRCRRLLEPSGLFFSAELGPWAQNVVYTVLTLRSAKKRAMFPLPYHNQKMIEYLADLLRSGQFAPVLDRRYPLEQIVDAYRYVETGRKIGNVVINVLE